MQPSTLDTAIAALKYVRGDGYDLRKLINVMGYDDVWIAVDAAIAELTAMRQAPTVARVPTEAISYILDNILWDYNSPLGESASVVRSWVLRRRTSSSPTAGE